MFGWDDALAAAAAVGGKLVGGLFGRNDAKRAAEVQRENALRQEALQREFAQNSISWKVEDAKRAGLHPLAALGASSTSYAPVSVGSVTDNSLGTAFAGIGQDISSAINKTRTGAERDGAFTKTVNDLTLQKMGLENELLSSQIAKLRSSINPPMPALADTPPPGGVRRVGRLLEGGPVLTTPASEAQQDAISKEYGDEGLPQIPGQVRFARDTYNQYWTKPVSEWAWRQLRNIGGWYGRYPGSPW